MTIDLQRFVVLLPGIGLRSFGATLAFISRLVLRRVMPMTSSSTWAYLYVSHCSLIPNMHVGQCSPSRCSHRWSVLIDWVLMVELSPRMAAVMGSHRNLYQRHVCLWILLSDPPTTNVGVFLKFVLKGEAFDFDFCVLHSGIFHSLILCFLSFQSLILTCFGQLTQLLVGIVLLY